MKHHPSTTLDTPVGAHGRNGRRRGMLATGLATLAVCLLGANAAWAQAYPSKPLRIIVHSSPGGQLDVTTRQVAQGMSEILGQPVVVENKPGADGLLGIRHAKSMPADGYTLLAASSTITVQPAVKAEPGYDLMKDFAPIGPMVRLPFLMLAANDKPFKSSSEFIAKAKASPNQLNFASGGNGSTAHLAAALMMQQAGIQLQHVPYKGNGAAMPDLIAGRADIMFEAYGSGGAHVRSGRLKALGVTSSKRLAVLPDVPTMAEQGLTNFSYDLWLGLLAPAGTPKEAVQKLSEALRTVLNAKKMVDRVHQEGAEIMDMTPDEFGNLLRRDLATNARLASSLGLAKE